MKRTIDITPSVDELAAEFAYLDSDDMALFFNKIGRIMENWGPGKLQSQLYDIVNSDVLGDRGESIIKYLHEFLESKEQ